MFQHTSTVTLVSFAAVIRVVTRHATFLPTSGEERCVTSDDPNNGCEGDYCYVSTSSEVIIRWKTTHSNIKDNVWWENLHIKEKTCKLKKVTFFPADIFIWRRFQIPNQQSPLSCNPTLITLSYHTSSVEAVHGQIIFLSFLLNFNFTFFICHCFGTEIFMSKIKSIKLLICNACPSILLPNFRNFKLWPVDLTWSSIADDCYL